MSEKEPAKAKLYTRAEATNLIPFTDSLWKDDFDPDYYQRVKNSEYSDLLKRWVTSDVLLINKVKVASLWFSDGTCWDTHVGWRKHTADEDFVKIKFEELTAKTNV